MSRFDQTMRFASLPLNSMSRRQGFTLVEFLIYITLTAIVVSSIVLMVGSILSARDTARRSLLLEQNVRFALTRIVSRIQEATTITTPASGASTTCALQMPTSSENPTTFAFVSSTLFMTEGTNPATALFSNEVEVIRFQCTRLSGSMMRLEIDARLQGVQDASQFFFDVTTTASTRN